MELINPYLIPKKDLPLIVLTDDRRSFLSWAIKHHSQGNYNHSMIMVKEDFFVSQDFAGYREVQIKTYQKNHIRLKFWKVKDITTEEKQKINEAVVRDLKAPWFKRRYDFLGIAGQFLGLRWINNTWTRYCSERIRDYYKDILKLPVHPTPSEINAICKTSSRMNEYGYWEDD